MSAGDNLQPKQFFHGSNADLEIGHVLTGGHPMQFSNHMPPELSQEHNQHVWMHTDPVLAGDYGKHVYEVRPNNPKVYEADEYDEDSPEHEWRHISPSATVVRRGIFSRTNQRVSWEQP